MNIYLLAIISGILMALSMSFDFLWSLAWIGLVPLFYVLLKNTLSFKQSFKVGLTYGFTFYIILLHWLFELYPLDNFGFTKVQAVVVLTLGWIFISLYEALWLSLIPIVFSKFKQSPLINIFLLCSLWIIIEWAQQLGSFGFSWGRLAVSQVSVPLLIQSSSLLGSLFISAFIIFINISFVYLIIYRKNLLKIKQVIICLISIVSLNAIYSLYNLNKDSNGEKITYSIVQGNISSSDKWNSNSLDSMLTKYLDLTYKSIDDANKLYNDIDFIIWPETAIPVTLYENQRILNAYKKVSSDSGADFLLGAFHEENDLSYNAIYNFSPNGEVSDPYFKRHLVPFGEYLPFANTISKLIPTLNNMNLFSDSLTPGDEVNILNSSRGNIGGLICFESIFPDITRYTTMSGSNILFLVTNDSWFKDSIAIKQHLKQAALRAVESNRYVLRAANTGISAVINNKGTILETIAPLKDGYIIGEGELINQNSIYLYLGDIIVFISFCFILTLYKKKKCAI